MIRAAVVGDARGIARVHVESWRTTYRGIFPQGVLDGLSIEDRAELWKKMLAGGAGGLVTLVACDGEGEVVGFASGGAERTGQLGCDGELHAIYLLEGWQGRGLGRALVRRFAAELCARGFGSMAVWVLARNPAVRFYEALGGKVIGEQRIERAGEWYTEIAYGWRELEGWPQMNGHG